MGGLDKKSEGEGGFSSNLAGGSSLTEGLIELFPYGVSMSANTRGQVTGRPILMLKNQEQSCTLPVWLTGIDASILLSQNQETNPSPHDVSFDLMSRLDMKLESCTFVDVVGSQVMVDLRFVKGPSALVLRERADKAMSFCLQAKSRFYAPTEMINLCRTVGDPFHLELPERMDKECLN